MHNTCFKKTIIILSLFLSYQSSLSQTTVIPFGSAWNYWSNTEANAPGTPWKGGEPFDDSGWPSGPARLGFGGDGEVTCIPSGTSCAAGCTPGGVCIKYTTTYFRKTIAIPDINVFTSFIFYLRRDDGAVVYVNGQEAWRSNMPGGIVVYSTFAATAVGAPDETAIFTSWVIPKSFFVSGNNVIAVEIHQSTAASSDLGFDMELVGNNLPFTNEVIYLWSGAITPTTAKVNAKMTSPSLQARLAASTSPALSSPVYGSYTSVNSANNVMTSLNISGLTPATKYYYAVESDGSLDISPGDIGSFTTTASGASSFKFTVGACGLSSNHPVYTKMSEKDPLFNLITGDFHYDNPNSATNIDVHRLPYENNMLSQTASRNLFLNYPLAYVWDDHDYSGNDSDSTAAGKTNARLAYREYVPHYPLGAGAEADRPIYQSFTIGRIHFILTDLRSVRRTPTMMGVIQKQWFKDQCIYARDNDLVIAWVSGVSFGGNQADNWGGFGAERTELGNFFKDNSIRNMFILSGDAHMVAIDNGNNHDFSTLGNNANKYPVMSAAALNQGGSYKGGTYSEAGIVIPPNGTNNSYLNPNNTFGQYGLVEITDAGGAEVCVQFTTYRVSNSGVEQILVAYNFCNIMNTALPVKISSFSAQADAPGKTVILKWTSEDETDCKYIIERSSNGSIFQSIAEIQCTGSNNSSRYTYTDQQPLPGLSFYRIKAVEQSGYYVYSVVKNVSLITTPEIRVSPNPAMDNLIMNCSNIPQATIARYTIFDATLKKQQEGSIQVSQGNSRIMISVPQLNTGIYHIRMILKDKEINERFVIQKR